MIRRARLGAGRRHTLPIPVEPMIAIVAVVVAVGAGCTSTDEGAERRVSIDGSSVVADPFELRPGLDPELMLSREPPADWAPVQDASLDDQIPEPWPESWVADHGQPFAPHAYKLNAALLCAYAREHPESRRLIRGIAAKLFRRMLSYTVLVGDARFVRYDFPHVYEGVPIDEGWTSGHGSGAVLQGSVALHSCWPNERIVEVVEEIARGYRRLRAETPQEPWFSFVTHEGYLWFEEQPLGDEPPPMILNGHINAIIGLYYLWDRIDRDEETLELIRAGISSVVEYIDEYRRPGQVNCYDLTPPCHADYGPERTVRQQQVLFEMTGDERFRKLRDALAADAGVDPERYAEQ